MDSTSPPPNDSLTPHIARPTPRISEGGARAAIAARLAALGQRPGLLDDGAIDALVAHADGSPRKLRAMLDTVLFLASTEHATRIDAALVSRASQQGADRPPSRIALPGRPTRRILALAGLAAGVVVIVGVLARHPSGKPAELAMAPRQPAPEVPAAPPPAAPPVQAPAAPTQAAVVAPPAITVPPPKPPPPVAKPPAMAQPASLPPLSAPIEVASLAVPPRPSVASPTAVLVLYPSAPGVDQRLASLTRRLQQVGIGEIRTRAVAAGAAQAPVRYFFSADSGLAHKVAGVLATEGWPTLNVDGLAPTLVRHPAGVATARRGLIEIQLP